LAKPPALFLRRVQLEIHCRCDVVIWRGLQAIAANPMQEKCRKTALQMSRGRDRVLAGPPFKCPGLSTVWCLRNGGRMFDYDSPRPAGADGSGRNHCSCVAARKAPSPSAGVPPLPDCPSSRTQPFRALFQLYLYRIRRCTRITYVTFGPHLKDTE
jgi:hypothetical protein